MLIQGVTLTGTYITDVPSIVTANLFANYDAATGIVGTTSLLDSSGNGRHATLFNNPGNTIVGSTRVLQLSSASTQYLGNTSGYGTSLDNRFTFDVWARNLSPGIPGNLIGEWGNGTFNSGWTDNQMGFNSTEINVGVYPAGYVTGTTGWSSSSWYHIVMTYDGTTNPTTRAYVNGVEGGTPLTGAKQSPGGTFLSMGLPAYDYLNGVVNYFNGYIGAWKIYNRALSDAEVLQNYRALAWRYQ
jgi:hypothetical protein